MTTQLNTKSGRIGRALTLAAVAAGSLIATPALATPHQGSLANPSQGDITITASVQARARLTGLTDVTFANQDPGTAASNAQNVCVWSNTSGKTYAVTATGDGASSAFTLKNSSNATVPYTVEWAGTSGQSTGTALSATTQSTSFTSGAVDQTCSSAPSTTASLIVKIGTTDLGTMTAGSNYSGVLTLSIAPQ
jgi:hypothetical protein